MPGPPLSHRAREQIDSSADSPLLKALGRTFGNPRSSDNPDGVINAGLAENSLLHDWLTEFWERPGTLKLDHTDLTYGKSIFGSDRIFAALGQLYKTHFRPHEPVEPSHIVTSNGLSPLISRLAAVTSDVGDDWIVPAPWYNGFKQDLQGTSQVGIASVAVPAGALGTVGEVEALEQEMQRRRGDSSAPKVTAVLLTSPHNPLGFCYSRDVLVQYCKFAERWNLYLVADEIYALSVFDADDCPDALPFTSILSIDVAAEAGCDPSRIIQLYGASKDFGCNGLRAGVAVIQHNGDLMSALASTAIEMRMGSPTDALWSALLTSPELPTYLSLNKAALGRAYRYLTSWLRAHDLPYTPAHAGHFVLVDWRRHVDKVEVEGGDGARGGRFAREVAFLDRIVDAGVYLGPGFSYACPEPGCFRMTFSRFELEIALERLEKLVGLEAKARELSRLHPS
ncbi:hypothetical protein JCM8208_001355 [Rhodotorula glutinis]